MPSPLHELRRLLNQCPFQPFTLFLENGDRLVVRQPDMVVVSPLSLVPVMDMEAEEFAASFKLVWIGGAYIPVNAIEYNGPDGFPVDLSMVPDDATWAEWRRLRTWTKYRRPLRWVLIAAILVLGILPFCCIDDGQGPIGDVIRCRRTTKIIGLCIGAAAAGSALALYMVDRRASRLAA